MNKKDHKYENPTPVAVVLVPIKKRVEFKDFSFSLLNLLYIKRGINPAKGEWAFPGGFVDKMENIEIAAIRELEEETNYKVKKVKLYKSEITKQNRVIVFTTIKPCKKSILKEMKTNVEVLDFNINGIMKLAFPTHEKIANDFLNKQNVKKLIKIKNKYLLNKEEYENLLNICKKNKFIN